MLDENSPPMNVEEFRLIRDLIHDHCGIYFQDDSQQLLERRLGPRLTARSLVTWGEYYRFLRYHTSRKEELEEIVERITTNETYFFREMYQLDALRDEILPEIAARKPRGRHLTLWSAGCSTGEEAYTAAILVIETGLFADWEVRVFGSLQRPVVNGELTLEDTTVRPALTLLRSAPPPPDPTITVVRATEDPRPASPSPAQSTAEPSGGRSATAAGEVTGTGTLFERLAIDLRVKTPRDTWVQLEDGSIEFRGDIQVSKVAYESISLVGTLESVRGWYSFHGRKFSLERGYIYFTGQTPVDPSLDIVMRHTVQEYRVDIVLGGTANSPELTLRSEPTLEQADVLALLMFGKTTNALTSGEKSSLQSQALQTAAGYIANDLRQSLAKSLGIDNLELDVGETLNKSRIGAGTYVRENVFVSTSQQLGEVNNQEFAIEYSLSENWQIKASTTTGGEESIDVQWQKRY